MEEPVTIVDREVLKVLSADTRMDILKELSQGGRTPSYLSKKLNKNDATIVEHLDVLSKAGLVKRVEQPGKKWVFYTLTDRGIGIISNKSRRLVIILAVSLIALILGGSFLGLIYSYQAGTFAARAPTAESEKEIPTTSKPVSLYVSVILIITGMTGMLFYIVKKTKFKLDKMKKSLFVFLLFVLMIGLFSPLVKADGMPYPPIRPQIKEEHQIAFIELKNKELVTTLDLGIRNKPKNIFPVLENSVYISENNPVWIKTFILPKDFSVKDLCINSYDFRYYNEPLAQITINGNIVYPYTKSPIIEYAEGVSPIYSYYGQTYCQFISNKNFSNPIFVNVSNYFMPGQYNTIEIRRYLYRSFSIQKIYLTSGTVTDKVKIIIPFKIMPKSVEIGGTGLDIYSLDYPFREKREWYGYYRGSLFSAKEAPELAQTALGVEQSTKSQIIQTQVATDATGGFQGKVSDVIAQVSVTGTSENQIGPIIRFAGVSEIENLYKTYMQDSAYIIELNIQPYELKRITIKWAEDITDENYFPYYYPLGTGKTWAENISYTAIYVKLPKPYAINYVNLEGKEVASDDNYNYYRWKFVDSNPDQDLHINVKKLSPIEQTLLGISIWMGKNSGVVVIAIILIIMGIIIYKYCKYYEQVGKKSKKRF